MILKMFHSISNQDNDEYKGNESDIKKRVKLLKNASIVLKETESLSFQ